MEPTGYESSQGRHGQPAARQSRMRHAHPWTTGSTSAEQVGHRVTSFQGIHTAIVGNVRDKNK
jgi:hypothetical protein